MPDLTRAQVAAAVADLFTTGPRKAPVKATRLVLVRERPDEDYTVRNAIDLGAWREPNMVDHLCRLLGVKDG